MNFAPNDSARAISSTCRWSTASVAAAAAGSTSISYSASRSAARVRSAFQLIRRSPSACRFRKRFSATDSVGMIVDFWYTQATRACHAARSDAGGAGSPSNRIRPPSGLASPVRSDTSVDFPAPLRPTSACASPGATEMPTSISARVAPKLLETASAVATGRPVVPAALRSCSVIA